MCYSFLFTRFGSEESPQLKLLSMPGTAGSGAPGRLMTGCGGRGVVMRTGKVLVGAEHGVRPLPTWKCDLNRMFLPDLVTR